MSVMGVVGGGGTHQLIGPCCGTEEAKVERLKRWRQPLGNMNGMVIRGWRSLGIDGDRMGRTGTGMGVIDVSVYKGPRFYISVIISNIPPDMLVSVTYYIQWKQITST